MLTYRDRDAILLSIGFSSYTEYLKSDLWTLIKKFVTEEKGDKCYICQVDAVVVHHGSYAEDVLRGLNTDPLYPMCLGCHHRVEFREDGTKRTLAESIGIFHQLRRKFPKQESDPSIGFYYRDQYAKRGRNGRYKRPCCSICNAKLGKKGKPCKNCQRREQGKSYGVYDKFGKRYRKPEQNS